MRTIAMREALREAIDEEMAADDMVILMGEEVAQYNGAYKVSQGLLDKYGDKRVLDTPIVEAGFAGIGMGAAFLGVKPIIEMMTFNFCILALDQIINTAAKVHYMSHGQISCPIVIRGAGGAGGALSAQHSQSLEAQYAHIPGLKVMAPSTSYDAKGMLKSAIQDPDPVIFIESEILYATSGEVPEEPYTIPIGVGDIKREGSDVTIIAWSRMVLLALDAAKALESQGVSAEVLDPRTLRPLDFELIAKSVKKTNRVVIVEEGWPQVSVGASISERISRELFDWLDAPILRVTQRDIPMPYAFNLEPASLPSVEQIVEAALKVTYKK